MSGPYGRICRDLFGQSLHIKGKLVLDESSNLTVANSFQDNAHISGNLLTNGICEYEMNQGISVKGNLRVGTIVENTLGGGVNILSNVCILDGYQLQVSKVTEKVTGNGVVVDKYIPRQKMGIARVWGNTVTNVDNGNTIQIPLLQKSFESTFTTPRGIAHPNGNTSITFQTPSSSSIICGFTSALVRMNVALGVAISAGEANDCLVFTIRKNTTDVVSKFTHALMGPCIDVDQTFAWSDMVSVAPDDVLDLFVNGGDFSGNLDAEIRPGVSETFMTFEIESFE